MPAVSLGTVLWENVRKERLGGPRAPVAPQSAPLFCHQCVPNFSSCGGVPNEREKHGLLPILAFCSKVNEWSIGVEVPDQMIQANQSDAAAQTWSSSKPESPWRRTGTGADHHKPVLVRSPWWPGDAIEHFHFTIQLEMIQSPAPSFEAKSARLHWQ